MNEQKARSRQHPSFRRRCPSALACEIESGENWRGVRRRRRTASVWRCSESPSRLRDRRGFDHNRQYACDDGYQACDEIGGAELAMSVMQKIGMVAGRAVDAAGDDGLQAGSTADFLKADEVRRPARHCKRWRRDIEQDRKQQRPGYRQSKFSGEKHCAIVPAGLPEIICESPVLRPCVAFHYRLGIVTL